MAMAVKVSNNDDERESYYRCSNCNAMFKPMIFFSQWDFFDCIPRMCPNCGKRFDNGMHSV